MDPQRSFWPTAAWPARLVSRVAILWPAKMAANTLGMTAFFIAYFWVLHHPLGPVTVMPLTALDRWIAFRPGAMPLYFSLWLYVSLPLALVRDRRELAACGLATGGLSVIGMAIFLFAPTTVPPSGIDWSLHPSVSFLKTIDLAGNACPSLHVAFAVFTAVWLARLLNGLDSGRAVRALNLLWCLGIVYSTLALRQHVVWDVVGGAALGLIVAGLHEAHLKRPCNLARGGLARRHPPLPASLEKP